MANFTLNNVIRMIALVILLGVVVYIGVLSTAEDGVGLRGKISRLSMGDVVFPIALSLLSYFFRFVRWRIILKQFGHNLPLKNDCIYYLSGFALTMTPGKSGETIRSAFLLQAQVPVQASISAFIIERFFDLLVVAISFMGARLAYVERYVYKINPPTFVLRLFNMLSQASIALKPKSIATYAFLGVAAWGAQGIGFYSVVCIFAQNIDVFSAISTYCAGLFVGAASLIPGGIGVTEGSLAWLLQTQGLDQNSALLSALISRGCTLWLAVAIGCGALAAIIKGQTI
jgi:glycosyltransferase 2 family protein